MSISIQSFPTPDRLNISLVDGFCGGGSYRKNGEIEYGSPIILLKAVEAARSRLNSKREKPLEINARFFFIDKSQDHVECLRQEIVDAGFSNLLDTKIKLIVGNFAQELPDVLTAIKSEQRAGRSIFVLDQWGYSDVPMTSVRSIFSTLERPEVILTFAIDSLLNYLQADSAALELYRQFGVDDRFIAEWNCNKADDALGRLITQRALMSNIQNNSGAEFFTPFMLWSPTDNRWMMLAHLSRHQAARDKMLGVHWDIQNSFRHVGKGSLFSLGFDARLFETKDALFSFSEDDRRKLEEELLCELPAEIRNHMSEEQVSVQTLLMRIGNRTAATNQDLFGALEQLAVAKEIEVVSTNGSVRRSSSQIRLSDGLILPRQPTFRF